MDFYSGKFCALQRRDKRKWPMTNNDLYHGPLFIRRRSKQKSITIRAEGKRPPNANECQTDKQQTQYCVLVAICIRNIVCVLPTCYTHGPWHWCGTFLLHVWTLTRSRDCFKCRRLFAHRWRSLHIAPFQRSLNCCTDNCFHAIALSASIMLKFPYAHRRRTDTTPYSNIAESLRCVRRPQKMAMVWLSAVANISALNCDLHSSAAVIIVLCHALHLCLYMFLPNKHFPFPLHKTHKTHNAARLTLHYYLLLWMARKHWDCNGIVSIIGQRSRIIRGVFRTLFIFLFFKIVVITMRRILFENI